MDNTIYEDFYLYKVWCKEKGLKPCKADNLHRFISHLTKA
nr:MAG TPA: RFX DNA-binding domain protein [Caudoviricetes sp.]